jgi:predicted permease
MAGGIMRALPQDIRLAFRHLRQQPGFTFVAVATLALGIGANTAIFTLVHALVLRSLPVERPGELYRLGNTNECCVNSGLQTSYSLFSTRLFEHLHANSPEFKELAGFQATTMPIGLRRPRESAPQPMPGAFVTGNYFTMFSVKPAAGRLLDERDDRPEAAPVAVMSHRAWTQFYARDPSIVGETVVLNGRPTTIVGVSAEPFFGDTIRADPAAVWIPLGQEPLMRGAASLRERADSNWLYAIGRVTGDANPSQISARLTTSLQQWLSAQPFVTAPERPQVAQVRIVVVPAGGGVASAQAQYGRSLNLLFAAAAMVLLIGVANLANLLLARADRGQAAIRAALGASTGRLIRQALTEGVLLALLGGLAGIALGAVSTRAILTVVFPTARFVPVDAAPSGWVWLFAIALAVFTGALFAAAPAWAMSRTAPLDALSGVGRGSQGRSFVPRGSLVIVQVALSLVLLSSAGLLVKSLANLERQPLGFTPANRLVVFIDPPAIAGDIPRLTDLYSRFDERLRGVPGVERVAFSMYSPMEGNNWSSRISIGGRKPDPDMPIFSSWNRVTSRYFETIGTPVLRGRGIDERDTPTSKRVVVVNETLVRRYFEREDPIGQTLGIGDPSHAGDFEIVGVVEDVKYSGATSTDVRPMMFIPSFQAAPYKSPGMVTTQGRSMLLRSIVVQVAPTSRNLEAGIRQALASVDQNLNVLRIIPMPAQVGVNFRLERVMAWLASTYGILALALASLGLYGVTAYGVSQRTREIGVRIALGADRWGIVRTCVRGPLFQTCAGLAIGLVGAFVAGRALNGQLYEIGGLDLKVFAGTTLALVVSAMLAASLPARRAASVNPAAALRGE